MRYKLASWTIAVFVSMAVIGLNAFAHCDTYDGPVIKAAQAALDQNNPNLVLIWVPKPAEAKIKQAFSKAVAARVSNPEAKEKTDRQFFETFVRVHREGEGEPYTGIKPVGTDLGPAIPAADQAVASGNIEPLIEILTKELRASLQQRFKDVESRKSYDPNDVTAGREYVHHYVRFLHQVEGTHGFLTKKHGHEEH
ncbi:MAG: hypothetical protein A2428_16235 [Bdellovibrionales bacterium RIFOXYC1_FULL_54_43]|nr:MAG: hypothetical protein A2428_16235 [Bdellovibrionales bacterium RIFOXYC1_FULL_54_43]OFZ81210.1 MAG: hypothetical protein A2603_14290 [Bdellovibrionales bacterium RIFOXYD1_FULL_55_31]